MSVNKFEERKNVNKRNPLVQHTRMSEKSRSN